MDFHCFSWGRAPRALQWQVWTSLPSSMHSSSGVNYLFIYLFIWNRVTCSLKTLNVTENVIELLNLLPSSPQCWDYECVPSFFSEPTKFKCLMHVSHGSFHAKLRDNTSKIIWPRTWNKVDSLRHDYLTSPCLKNYVFESGMFTV